MFGFRSSMKAHLANFILNKNKVIVNVQVIRMKLQNLEVDPLWDNFKNAILHHSKPKSLRSIYIYLIELYLKYCLHFKFSLVSIC